MPAPRVVLPTLLFGFLAPLSLAIAPPSVPPPDAVGEASLSPRIELAVDHSAMFNALPTDILTVTQGPDGKVWLTVGQRGPGNVSTIREVIRREFREKMPQVSGARPILFEPGGRTWFLIEQAVDEEGRYSGTLLLGYDGTNFVERAASSAQRGFSVRSLSAAYADGTAVFATADAIYLYDGKQWSSREVPESRQNYVDAGYRLFTEPDGKGIVAVPRDGTTSILRWRNGAWTKLAGSITGEVDRGYPSSRSTTVAPRSDGVWLLTGSELRFLSYEKTTTQPDAPLTVEKLVERLKDKDFETREEATQVLIARGSAIESELRKALDANRKEEARYRLEYILANLRRSAYTPRPVNAYTFGKYRASDITLLVTLSNGATLIGARSVTTADKQPIAPAPVPEEVLMQVNKESGVLVQEADGSVRLLGGAETYALMQSASNLSPQLLVDGHELWAWGGLRRGPTLIDLNNGKVVHSIPVHNATGIHAATQDGTVFLSVAGRMYAYHPDGKDSRVSVQASQSARSNGNGMLTGDGAYWFYQSSERGEVSVARFDGKEIKAIPGVSGSRLLSGSSTVAGHDGFLQQQQKGWTLVTQRGAFSDELLEDLVAHNAAEFTRAFVGSRPTGQRDSTHVQADTNGNVWVLRQQTHEVKVFFNGTWLEATDALTKAGATGGKASMLLALGESKKILAITTSREYPRPDAAKSPSMFMLSVNDGAVVAEALEEEFFATGSGTILYSPRGEPWVPVVRRKANEPPAMAVCRITDAGVAEAISEYTILAVNTDGSLLVSRGFGEGPKLYRDGKVNDVGSMSAPRFAGRHLIFSGLDTLCEVGPLGIELIDLKDAGHPVILNPATDSYASLREISPLGFAAFSVSGGSSRQGVNLVFFPLKP